MESGKRMSQEKYNVSGDVYCPQCMSIVIGEDREFVEDIGHCKSCEAALSDKY